jgi:hypothetical protein
MVDQQRATEISRGDCRLRSNVTMVEDCCMKGVLPQTYSH